MSTESWGARLDRFAACLAEQEAALAAGRPEEISAFAPGPSTEPLPAELAVRARQLHAQSMRLQADLASTLAGVGRELQLLTALDRDTHNPRVSLLDATA